MNHMPYIGFWKRAAAFIIDGIICSVPPALICLPLMIWQGGKLPDGEPAPDALAVLIIIYLTWQVLNLVCFWLYFAWLESGPAQATWGKRLLGMKVIDKDGGRISFARASGRTFSKLLSYTVLYIGFIMAGMTNRKRALHDYICQTLVVRKDFQPGDELPDTPSHPVWLGLTAALIVCFVLAAFILAALAQSPAFTALNAAQRLQTLSAQASSPQTTTENDVVYSRRADGYRAVFYNGQSGSYTLFLPAGSREVCCEDAPDYNCALTGFPACD